MSFQHFRLGELAMGQPLPPHLMQHTGTTNNITGTTANHPESASQFTTQLVQNTSNSFSNNHARGHTSVSPSSSSKQPYGSGDTDDGYTLIFPNIDAFHEWRNHEEETQMVEFVKGDTHGSKAVPPRFKDHTKLVCARHSRSGRKKYVKKHPERVRKVPSRKLEGVGCSASISYKTYFDTEEVRACYVSQHSHEIGLANLPFTRRGRKAAVQQEKERSRKIQKLPDGTEIAVPASMGPTSNAIAGPSGMQSSSQFSTAVSMLAPLPAPSMFSQPSAPHPYGAQPSYPYPPPPNGGQFSHDRWENMSTLFSAVREHARGFEYPTASVAALETVLIRLYLESPVGMGPQPSLGNVMQNGMVVQTTPQSQSQTQGHNSNGPANGGASHGNGVDGSGDDESS